MNIHENQEITILKDLLFNYNYNPDNNLIGGTNYILDESDKQEIYEMLKKDDLYKQFNTINSLILNEFLGNKYCFNYFVINDISDILNIKYDMREVKNDIKEKLSEEQKKNNNLYQYNNEKYIDIYLLNDSFE
jgi:hypothetical protein